MGAPLRVWAERLWLAVAACGALAVVGFYAGRMGMPLPIFSTDESAYLIHALFTDQQVALNPSVMAENNSVHLSLIRAAYETHLPYVIADRAVNAAAYLGGLLLLWRWTTARMRWESRAALLLLAVAFPYYRFAASNLAEGLFVGILALIALATGVWHRSRPVVHALAAGVLSAMLVLVKPNGIATVAALGAVAALDTLVSGGWRRLPVRVGVFIATFFVTGNLIQFAAEEPVSNPLAFFVARGYGAIMAAASPPGADRLGALAMAAMLSATAILAGPPLLIGAVDLIRRWRAARGRFVADGRDLIFLLLATTLGATLVMVAMFAMKISGTITETFRLLGRYFEFFAPMIWLAAAPALGRPIGRWTAWASAGVMLAGLAGLMACLHAGIVLFPWDSSVLTAFFHPDPVRAPLGFKTPYQAMAIAAVLLAAGAVALRAAPPMAGLGLTVALGLLSTHLDHIWVGPLVAQRNAPEHDMLAIRPALPPVGEIVFLAPDENDGHLGFLRLNARPRVELGPPGRTPPEKLAGVSAVIVSGPETPPGGPWRRTYGGEHLSLFQPTTP